MPIDKLEALKAKSQKCRDRLYRNPKSKDVIAAKQLIDQLKAACEYELMGDLLEAATRHAPKDATIRRLYAQKLIETGEASVAIDVLKSLRRKLGSKEPEYAEVGGLLGRAYKQIFFDTEDKTSAPALAALKKAIQAYRKIYEIDPKLYTWHGVNLVALLSRARRLGSKVAPDLSPKQLANDILRHLQKTPEKSKDEWYLATLAEVSLATDDWQSVEARINDYLSDNRVTAFQLNSLLRQLTQVWDLESRDERARGLVSILRARIAEMRGGALDVAAYEIQRLRNNPDPVEGQLEAILGKDGHKTYRWWRTGLERARAVAAVYQKLGNRIGTGFLVRAGALNLQPEDELLLLTNFHVVNPSGSHPGLRPEDAEVAFETESLDQRYSIIESVWSSPIDKHDACLLRLESIPEGAGPLPFARCLPALEDNAKVYVIGHPRGKELSFSFQDNELLDHEGSPKGNPSIADVCRVHYRAPTEPGSSGSPVFNANLWQVIALHHAGGKLGMSRLNGKKGTYSANEGIAVMSIAEAIGTSR